MAEFMYKLLDDNSYAVMSYEGNDAEVVIPDTYGGRPVTLLADDLFKNHSEITKVTLPNQLKVIGGFVFDGCVNLKNVKLPDTLEQMWQYAFVRCGIEIIEIPGNVNSILAFTFQDCLDLRMVVCHEGTKKIYGNAFLNCVNLEVVAVHKSTEIAHNAFDGCEKINPEARREMNSTCKCPMCTGDGKPKKIDVFAMLKKNI